MMIPLQYLLTCETSLLLKACTCGASVVEFVPERKDEFLKIAEMGEGSNYEMTAPERVEKKKGIAVGRYLKR